MKSFTDWHAFYSLFFDMVQSIILSYGSCICRQVRDPEYDLTCRQFSCEFFCVCCICCLKPAQRKVQPAHENYEEKLEEEVKNAALAQEIETNRDTAADV